MSKRTVKKISEQLRAIIDDCGLSRYELARQTDIDESTLAKFYNGHRGLSMKALDRLGGFLELTVTSRRKPNETKGK